MSERNCDLLIIGGGPAGISAAVNAASEGLYTIICDSTHKFGGQAGQSSLIENFLGFPEGISGEELTQRAIAQAAKFSVDFYAPCNINRLEMIDNLWHAYNDYEECTIAKSVLLALGVTYKSLTAKNISRFIGAGVSYGSPSLSEIYSGKTVVVIGGANSAGQAAAYLASCPDCNVKLIIRGNDIADKMSNYLVEKVSNLPNIEVITNSVITEAKGKMNLESIVIRSSENTYREIEANRLFILIGAQPKTAWLKGTAVLDSNGFIITGENVKGENSPLFDQTNYKPLTMETAPGLFAAGDIRVGSVKRVAFAVGEGSRAVNDIHEYLSRTVIEQCINCKVNVL